MNSVSPNQWFEGDVLELSNDEVNTEGNNKPPPKQGDQRETMSANKSFNQQLKEFASETSFGGISKVALSDGYIRRFVWLLISVTCYALAIMYCLSLVNVFLRKPIKTTIDISYTQNIEFPSVTVCNLNQFRNSKLQEVEMIQDILQSYSNETRNTSDDSSFEESLSRLRKMLKKDLASDEDNEDNLDDVEVDEDLLLEHLVAITASYYNQTHLKQVGHQFDDMILSCSWRGANCRTGYFAKYWVKHWNWKYGNCFTFNPGGNETGHELNVFVTSKTGPHHGLKLDINIEQSGEYVEELTADAGALITVHRARQMPFPYDDGITVSPGFSSSIAVRKESVTRVDPHDNGSCYSSENLYKNNIYRNFMGGSCAKYSVKACAQSCLAKAQHETCGCSDAKYAWFVRRVCHSLEELQCIHRVSTDFKNHKLGCEGQCANPCKQESFLHSIMTAKLTSKEKETRKKKDFGKNNETDFIFDDNFLRVKIYYGELNLQQIEESTYYELDSLIGDIGGQLGLWVGVSIISLAEFGELLINLCIVAMRKYQDRKKNKAAVSAELQ